MMVKALSVLLLLAVTRAADLDAKGVSVADKFAMFKAQFSKSYATADLEASAEAAFAATSRLLSSTTGGASRTGSATILSPISPGRISPRLIWVLLRARPKTHKITTTHY
jgi:hypothetical protein